MNRPPFTAVMIVPTGIGATIGGYAGDATPCANLLASACDRLITHPNVVNAATLFAARSNVAYVEGYALDRFCLGEWALRPVHGNRIGLLIDKGVVDDPVGLAHLLTAAEACRAVYGVDLVGWLATAEPLAARIVLDTQGASSGEVTNPDVLESGAQALVRLGAQAIAVVTRMPELPAMQSEAYLQGMGPDPIGGIEALVSHFITRRLKVPCAHAPYEPPELASGLDPRVAAESVGYTFLPCILAGLGHAPRPVLRLDARREDWLFEEVQAVVVPSEACGGVPVLAAAKEGIPIVAVGGNQVVSRAHHASLGLPHVIEVESYLEAAGVLLALKEGLSLASLRRPLKRLERLAR